MPGPGSSTLADSEIPTGPDGHGETEAFQQGAGALHGLGRHAELGGNGVVRGSDVAAGARIRDGSVSGRDPEERVDCDVRSSPGGLTCRAADGGLDLGEPAGAVSPRRVPRIGAGGQGRGPRRPTTI